ncbi:hypothetical protein QVD17_14560 [Tagetes erecta]|uniref:Uncharacterized protein n=1 Tax=Tagetes erecta TaxID=13708 RepID=A0AAD8KY08_TARER|nr:hypothetical protein QVD17_14560 [Tagetes erecta]
MHVHNPARYQSSQGVKLKHVFRIFLLIAACCWLIFQIKRFHYKSKDLEYVDTKMLLSTNSVDQVVKLGRKDLQRKETDTREEDGEIYENERRKFDDDDDDEDSESSHTANEAREEHYKADDASSEVTHEHEDQTLDYSKFLEISNISYDHSQYDINAARAVEELETFLKSSNVTAVAELETILGSSKTVIEAEDAIASTDFIHLQDLGAIDDGEDTDAE